MGVKVGEGKSRKKDKKGKYQDIFRRALNNHNEF